MLSTLEMQRNAHHFKNSKRFGAMPYARIRPREGVAGPAECNMQNIGKTNQISGNMSTILQRLLTISVLFVSLRNLMVYVAQLGERCHQL